MKGGRRVIMTSAHGKLPGAPKQEIPSPQKVVAKSRKAKRPPKGQA